MFNWHTQFNLTTTHTNEQEWVDEQSTFAQSKRLLAYGVKEPDAKLASNYYTDTELPMGGILNEKDYRGQSYQLTSSLSYFQTFQKHEVNAIAGIEINSRKMDGKTETNYGYLRERGHKFAKIVLENYSKYRNTVAENYPAITDTKDNKVSFYGAFTRSTTGTVSISTSGLTVQINSGKTFPPDSYRYGPSPEDGTPTRSYSFKM